MEKMVEFYKGTEGKPINYHPEIVITFPGRTTGRRYKLIKQILFDMVKPENRNEFYIARVWDDETGKNELNLELFPFWEWEDAISYNLYINTQYVREFDKEYSAN